jgi:hypothetical protein
VGLGIQSQGRHLFSAFSVFFRVFCVTEFLVTVRRAGFLYFLIVFGTGFLLSYVRSVWAVPRLGTRMAELAAMPILLVVIIVAAHWILRRMPPSHTRTDLLAAGLIALALLLTAEFSILLWLRGLSMGNYLASRDPVSGKAYYSLLALFALMPLLLRARQ